MIQLKFRCTFFFLYIFVFSLFFCLPKNYIFAQNFSQNLPTPPQQDLIAKEEKKIALSLQSHGHVQEDIFLEISFLVDLPQSAIPSIKITSLESPHKGKVDVLSGVPKTKLNFNNVGQYTLEVKTGYLLKST